MPSKGSKISIGNRDYIVNKAFHKQLVEKRKITSSYETVKKIIDTANQNTAAAIVEDEEGFLLPFGLGYLCAVKFKMPKPAIDWPKTKKVKKFVYHLNLHTFGYSVRTRWFRVGRIVNVRFHEVFKFVSYRTLARSVSEAFREGKPYTERTVSDFIEVGRMQNFANKKYRKEQKE